MKINQIMEDTYENITIIENIVDFIVSHMPDYIPENTTYNFGYFARGGNSGNDWLFPSNNSEIKSIKELIEENKNNPKITRVLEMLIYTTISFHNTEEYLNHTAYGEYHWGPIHIYVSRIQKSIRDFIIRYNEEIGKYPSMHLEKVLATLTHEIRHYFQDAEYSKYMRKPDRDLDKKSGSTRPWGERQIEWDAKWTDTLYQYNPKDYGNINIYVEEVMDDFLRWVKLTDKLKEHYRKKTASYYLKWYRKELEKYWNKIIKSMEPNIIKGYYSRNEVVDFVLDDLTWYNNMPELPKSVANYYKTKTIKYFEEITKPLKQEKKLKQHIESFEDEWQGYVESFLNKNYEKIKDMNTFTAASSIVNRLMDNHPDFFYSKNKSIYEISYKVNMNFYKRTVELIKNIKDTLNHNIGEN